MIPFRDNIPSRKTPFVTVVLILANILLHMMFGSVRPSVLDRGIAHRNGASVAFFGPYEKGSTIKLALGRELCGSQGGAVRTEGKTAALCGLVAQTLTLLLTGMFLHGGVLHLSVNMWFLWLFGENVEDRLGHARFLLLYLLSGIVAGIVQLYLRVGSLPMIGTSGAVTGVLGAYIVTYPYGRVLTFVPFFGFFWHIVELPAVLLLGGWSLVSFLDGLQITNDLGALYAQLGGFLAGIVLLWIMAPEPQGKRGPRWSELNFCPNHRLA